MLAKGEAAPLPFDPSSTRAKAVTRAAQSPAIRPSADEAFDPIFAPVFDAREVTRPVDNRPQAKGRYGKRKLPDARGKFVAVRCTDSEHATMTEKAATAGLSVGAYLRTLAIGSAGPRAIRRPPVERAELARLLGEIGKLGSNVNQIARVLNTTGDLPASNNLAAITADVSVMRAALMKALGRGD